jgi:hypothetical protein
MVLELWGIKLKAWAPTSLGFKKLYAQKRNRCNT